MRLFMLALLLVSAPLAAGGPVEEAVDPLEDSYEVPRILVMVMGKGWAFEEPRDASANQMVVRRLSSPVRLPEGEVGLDEVLDCIREQTGVDIFVNWPSCELVGIDTDTVIALGLTRGSADSLLRMTIKQASAENFDDDKIGWIIRDGVVQIATQFELKAETELRIYDLSPLVRSRFRPVGLAFDADAREETIAFHAWMRGQREYPISDTTQQQLLEQQIQQLQHQLERLENPEAQGPDPIAMGPGGAGGGGLFFADDSDRSYLDPSYEEYIDILIEMIQDTVGDPDEWLDEDSTICEVDGMFAVLTTRESHHAIESQLNMVLANEVRDHATILRDVQVMELLGRASALQLDGDFEGALVLADRALLIDQGHITAHAFRQVIVATLRRIREAEQLRQDRE